MDNNNVQVSDIEAALIGSVLRDGKLFTEAREIVKPETFENHAYGYAWLAMEHLYEQGMGIDTITVGDEIERMGKMADFVNGMWSGRALLSQLRSEGNPRNMLAYAENVQDYAMKRGLDGFFTKAVIWSKNGRRASEIIKDVTTELGKIILYSQSDEFTVPISTAVSEAYDETTTASNGEPVGVKTGLIDLDGIYGSLLPSNVYLVAGRPGDGKTGLLLTIARNVAEKNKRVGIFSLEMSRSQVAQRLISQESGVDLTKIIRGKMDSDEWGKYNNAVEVIEKYPIIINDLSSIDIDSIRQTARKMGDLDLIILDYIQLADSGKKKERRELEVSEVSRGLRYLARELNVPVLAASQMSREIEKRASKRPVLSDLRESGSLEQDAYSVMFLYTPDEKMPNTRELIVAKHRNGPVGSVSLWFRPEFTKFESTTSYTFNPNKG